MLSIAALLGANESPLRDGKVTIYAQAIATAELPMKESNSIRASILFASALLIRKGKAVIRQPGGDSIGRRRLDTHFTVFRELGAKLKIEHTVLSDGVTQETNFMLSVPKEGLRERPSISTKHRSPPPKTRLLPQPALEARQSSPMRRPNRMCRASAGFWNGPVSKASGRTSLLYTERNHSNQQTIE